MLFFMLYIFLYMVILCVNLSESIALELDKGTFLYDIYEYVHTRVRLWIFDRLWNKEY